MLKFSDVDFTKRLEDKMAKNLLERIFEMEDDDLRDFLTDECGVDTSVVDVDNMDRQQLIELPP